MKEASNDPKSIQGMLDCVPTNYFSDEIEDGACISGSGPDLKSLLSISINEFGLVDYASERLRSRGVFNVGHVASKSRIELERIVHDAHALEVIDWQLGEIGLSYNMNFCQSLISDDELSR